MTEIRATKTRGAAKKESAPEAIDAHAVRARLTGTVLKEADDILHGVIEAAKIGNYLSAKFLFEFAGILEPLPTPSEGTGADVKLRSLVDLLLEAAQKPQPEAQQETLSA